MKTPIVKTATMTAAFALVLGLSACGGNSSNDAEQSASPSAEEQAATTVESEADAGADAGTDGGLSADDFEVGGDFSGTLNGEPFEIENVGVACGEQDGNTVIGVGPLDAALTDPGVRSISLVVDGATSEVSLITIIPGDGESLNYTNIGGYSSDSGSVQAEIDGSTYTVTGEAAPSSSTETQPFEFTITCP
ncbi:lipoprotein LpqH [Actinomyces ruminicola]|uniref:Lipoprotein antigen n=1 Tax=Actinomyces ruminicola TaxID=332524 RepID=A0A1G9XCD7_9ACTO|nr:lipoprotein LpqH [Actinomyces ruminicola]SDM93973.1 lipoprotein antigen [Actinomyces ruminicola]